MHEIRNIIVRMRLGDSDRAIACTGLAGRPKAKLIRQWAIDNGWLNLTEPLPDDTTLVAAFSETDPDADSQSKSKVTGCSVEPYRALVGKWVEQEVQSKTIYQALQRNHQFTGSYSAV